MQYIIGMKKLTKLLLFTLILFSCNPQSKEEQACSSATNCDSGSTTVQTGPRSVSMTFNKSYFYNSNYDTWNEVSITEGTSVDLGELPIFSSTLAIDKNTATDIVSQAESQKNLGDAISPDDRNNIPYFPIPYKENTTYTFRYTKYDKYSSVKEQVDGSSATGEIVVKDGIAYLPIVNESFKNKLLKTNASDANASSYIHEIRFSAVAENSIKAPITTVRFKMNVEEPVKGYNGKLGDDALAYTLENRWLYYFTGADYVANRDFFFAYLEDDQEAAEAITRDIKVVFKSEPVITMTQKIFVEETFDISYYLLTGIAYPNRGVNYNQKTVILDSMNHFRRKIKVNGDEVTLTGGREFEYRDIPGGSKWQLQFYIDFLKSDLYPVGESLLTPLRPECNNITGSIFNPIDSANKRAVANATSGFYSACHVETDAEVNLDAATAAVSPLEKKDTFFEFFSYLPAKDVVNVPYDTRTEPGFFKGVSEVEFAVSGCVRVYTREASIFPVNPNPWALKSESSASCDDGLGGEGWSYFSIKKSDSIFRYVDKTDYQNYSGLINNIQSFNGTPTSVRPNFMFNGSTMNDRVY